MENKGKTKDAMTAGRFIRILLIHKVCTQVFVGNVQAIVYTYECEYSHLYKQQIPYDEHTNIETCLNVLLEYL